MGVIQQTLGQAMPGLAMLYAYSMLHHGRSDHGRSSYVSLNSPHVNAVVTTPKFL